MRLPLPCWQLHDHGLDLGLLEDSLHDIGHHRGLPAAGGTHDEQVVSQLAQQRQIVAGAHHEVVPGRLQPAQQLVAGEAGTELAGGRR